MTELNRKAVEERFRYLNCFMDDSKGIFSWFKDRALLSARVFSAPLQILLSGTSRNSSTVLISDPGASSEVVRDYRDFYLMHNFKEKGLYVSRGCLLPLNDSIPFVSFLSRYLLYCFVSLSSFFDFSRRPYRSLFRFFYDSLLLTLSAPGRQKVYVFQIVNLNYYLIAGFCRSHFPCEVLVCLSSTPIGNWAFRYFDIPCTILLNSHVQEEEVRYLQGLGEYKFAKALYTGSEQIKDTQSIPRQQPTIDIGFFSTGEWARDNMFQTKDIEKVRSYSLADNFYHRLSLEILETLVTLCRENQWRLRIYLHPYERELLHTHHIQSPYAAYADGRLIDLDSVPGNSLSKIFEARVAVSLVSTIIWERLDLGLLDSFIYDFKDEFLNMFISESLGPYKRCSFSSVPELKDKVTSVLRNTVKLPVEKVN